MRNLMKNKSYFLFIFALLTMAMLLPVQQARSQDTGLVTITANGSFDNVVAKFKKTVAKNGMMILGEINQGKILSMTGLKINAVSLFVGNPTIGNKAFSANAGIGIAIPVRVFIFEDKAGKVNLSYVKPSRQFAPFQNKQITMIGQKMDEKLGALTGMLAK